MNWGAAGAMWEPLAEGPRVPRGSSCSALLLWETKHRALRLWWSWVWERSHTAHQPQTPTFLSVCLSLSTFRVRNWAWGEQQGLEGRASPGDRVGATHGDRTCARAGRVSDSPEHLPALKAGKKHIQEQPLVWLNSCSGHLVNGINAFCGGLG